MADPMENNKIKTVKWDAKFDPQFQNPANDIQKQFKTDLQAARSDNPQISKPVYKKYGIVPQWQYDAMDPRARGAANQQSVVGRQALINRIGQRARNKLQPQMQAMQQRNKWTQMQNATTDRQRAQIARNYYDPTKHAASQIIRTGVGNFAQNAWNGFWGGLDLVGTGITTAMDVGQRFGNWLYGKRFDLSNSVMNPAGNTASTWYKNFRDNVATPAVNNMFDWRSQQQKARDAQLGTQPHKLTLTGDDRLQGATNDTKVNLFGKQLPITYDDVGSTSASLLFGGIAGNGTRTANATMRAANKAILTPVDQARKLTKNVANIAKTKGTKQAVKYTTKELAKPVAQYAGYSAAGTTVDWGTDKIQQQIANSDMDPQAKAFWMNFMETSRGPVQYITTRLNPLGRLMPKNVAVPQMFGAYASNQAVLGPLKNTIMPKFSPWGGVSQAQERKAETGSIVPKGVSPQQYFRTAVNNQSAKYDPQYRPFYRMFSDIPYNIAYSFGQVPGMVYPYIDNAINPPGINSLQQSDIRAMNADERLSRMQYGKPGTPQSQATAKQIYDNAMQNARTAPVSDAYTAGFKYKVGLPVSDAQLNSLLVAAGQPIDPEDASKGFKNPMLHDAVANGASKQIVNYFNQMKAISAQQNPAKRQQLIKSLKQKKMSPLHMQMALGILGDQGLQKAVNTGIGSMSSQDIRTTLQLLDSQTGDNSIRLKATISKYGAPAVGKRMTDLMRQAKTDQDVMRLSKDAIAISKFATDTPDGQQPQWKKEMTAVFSDKVQKAVWNDPLQNLPTAMGLWLASKGFSGVGQFISSPLAFWGSLGVLTLGGGLLLGGAFSGGQQQAPQQKVQQPQQVPFNLYSSSFMR